MIASAKINLMLHIVGRRADNYHLLQSLIMFAEYGDEIALPEQELQTPENKLQIGGEFAADLENLDQQDNLITKAALLIGKEKTPLLLNKKLPVSAGLGGGSADAAAVLRLLGGENSPQQLMNFASMLGSDVPACLLGKSLWLEGAGEQLQPVAVKFTVPILLVNHGQKLATAEVFKQFHKSAYRFCAPIAAPLRFANYHELLHFINSTSNMLEEPAKQIAPEIAMVIGEIKKLPDCAIARMSGSGASCFGIFPDMISCRKAEEILSNKHKKWWIKATTLLSD